MNVKFIVATFIGLLQHVSICKVMKHFTKSRRGCGLSSSASLSCRFSVKRSGATELSAALQLLKKNKKTAGEACEQPCALVEPAATLLDSLPINLRKMSKMKDRCGKKGG